MTSHERLKARQREARRLMALYEAELAGLVHAEGSATSVLYSHDADEQRAFERALTEGRQILAVYPAMSRCASYCDLPLGHPGEHRTAVKSVEMPTAAPVMGMKTG